LLQKVAILFSPLVAVALSCTGQDLPDHGSGIIYFLLTDQLSSAPALRSVRRPTIP
jgi:hypothetical protein